MNREQIDISSFERNSGFYGRLELLMTIKSFELEKIRKRYIESRKNNKSGRSGSAKRRNVGLGGVARVTVENGEIIDCEVLATLREPRGISFNDENFAISSENEVFIFDKAGRVKVLKNPWFSYIHTVDFSPDRQRILVSSSGFDVLMEFHLESLTKSWEWFAWENGFNTGRDPETNEEIVLSRKSHHQADNKRVLVISDPENQKLPTAMRAAFINSAVYDPIHESNILATFFHEGTVYSVNYESGGITKRIDELKNPHGGRRVGNTIMATSTAEGKVVLNSEKGERRFDFSRLPGKEYGLEGMEWLQNSIPIGENIITIDSNRTSLVVFDPVGKKVDLIKYNNNWAVQDIIEGRLNANQETALKKV